MYKSISSAIVAGLIVTGTVAPATQAHASESGANTKAGQVSTQNSKNDTSKPIDFDKAKNMSPQELKDSLTSKDIKLNDKEYESGAPKERSKAVNPNAYTNININKYIAQKGYKPAKIVEDSRIDSLPKYSYKSGKYIGVVVHETANPYSTLQGETNYMYSHYYNAFVHAFVDGKEIRQTAPADYLSWGAGSVVTIAA